MCVCVVRRFSLLEKEVKAVFGAQDKEGKLIVEKLKLFIQIEFDTIQHVIVSTKFISFRVLLCSYYYFSGEDVLTNYVVACEPAVHSARHLSHRGKMIQSSNLPSHYSLVPRPNLPDFFQRATLKGQGRAWGQGYPHTTITN